MSKVNFSNRVLSPNFPWFIVEFVDGVDLDKVVQDGIAEVIVDNKFQGKYLNICKVLKQPNNTPKDVSLHAIEDDYVCVWASAIESFDLPDYGKVHLVRNPDIFLVLKQGDF
jgi:hypothetical protein